MNDWQMQRQLYGSPYSGCRCFTGWPSPPVVRIPANTTWPSPYAAPGAILCSDRVQSTPTLVKTGASGLPGAAIAPPAQWVSATRTHFRPSLPFPMWQAGGERSRAMPSAWTQAVGVPPYNLRAMAFPSTSGPYSIGIASGIVQSEGAEIVVGGMGNASLHSLGYS